MGESYLTDGVTVTPEAPAEQIEQVESALSMTEQPAEVAALDKPFSEYSVTEFLLLLIFVLLLIQTVLALFTRKWGFPEW